MESAFRMIIGNPQGNIPRGRHRYSWENNIKMDRKGTEDEDVDCT